MIEIFFRKLLYCPTSASPTIRHKERERLIARELSAPHQSKIKLVGKAVLNLPPKLLKIG